MAEVLGFEIEIGGFSTIAELQKQIKAVNAELKNAEVGSAEYTFLTDVLGGLKSELKEIKKDQKAAQLEFEKVSESVGAYDQLNARLRSARKRFKDLAAAGQENTEEARELLEEIEKLDTQLKEIDASVGQFQRNVGSYEEAIDNAIQKNADLFGEFAKGILGIGDSFTQTAGVIAAGFVGFEIGSQVIQGFGDFNAIIEQTNENLRQVSIALGVTGEEADALTASITGTSEAFDVDFNQTLDATNQVIQQFGVSGAESIDLINQALAASADQARTLGLVESELSKLAGLGIEPDGALALITEASNRGFNVDVLTEPLIALREGTDATVEALENAFGQKRTEEIFATFQTAPLEAIQQISEGFNGLNQNSTEAGAILADVFKAAGEDNIELVKSLGDLNLNLDELTANAGEAGQRQLELAAANEELAAAQLAVTKELEASRANFEIITTRIQAGFFKVLLAIINAFKPLINAFRNAGEAIGELIGSFTGAKNAGEAFAGVGEFLQRTLSAIGRGLALVVDGFTFLVKTARAVGAVFTGDLVPALELFTKEGQRSARANELLAESTENITSSLADEKQGLDNAFAALKETEAGTDARREAVQKLQDLYGEYLPNVDLETAGQEDLKDAYLETAQAIAAAAIQRELQNRAAQITAKRLDAEAKLQEAIAQTAKTQDIANNTLGSFVGAGTEALKLLSGQRSELLEQADAQQTANKAVIDAAKEVEALRLAQERLTKRAPELAKELSGVFDFEAIKKNSKTVTKETKNTQDTISKQQRDAIEKRRQELEKDRQKFLDSEAKFLSDLNKLEDELQKRITDTTIRNIEDRAKRALKTEQEAGKRRLDSIDNQEAAFLESLKVRQDEAVRLFGEGSEEAKRVQEQTNKERIDRLKQFDKLREQQIIENGKKENEVIKKNAEDATKIREAQLQKQLDSIDKATEDAIRQQQILFNQGLINEEQFNKKTEQLTLDRIDLQRKALQERLKLLEESAQLGVEISQDEIDKIKKLLDGLLLKRTEIEKDQTDTQKEESDKRTQQEKENLNRIRESITEAVIQATQFFDALDERRIANIQKDIEAQDAKISALNKQIENSTGLQREFLEQQLDEELKARQRQDREIEKIEKNQAKRAKALAIAQAIVNGALAITKILAEVPKADFGISTAILVAAAAATTAAQVATIAAQPLHTGGIVGFADGGAVPTTGNGKGGRIITPKNIATQPGGDNVLITAKRGEVVLNKRQQNLLGGARTFRKIGVPGFQSGGFVPSVSAPNLSALNGFENLQMDFLNAVRESVNATNQRIDRIQVLYTATTEDDRVEDERDRKEIEFKATL